MDVSTLCPECGYPLTFLGVSKPTRQDEHLCRRCGTLVTVTTDTYAAVYPAWWQKGGTTEAYSVSLDWLLNPMSVY